MDIINANNDYRYNLILNTRLLPSLNNISEIYNFYLLQNNQTGLVNNPILEIYVNLLLEFQWN